MFERLEGADGAAELQPVWLTESDENPNEATVLFLADGAVSNSVDDYELVCTLFDGRDGDDIINGGDQFDFLFGGPGDDELHGDRPRVDPAQD